MKTTTNYNLRKPDYTDASDIDVINSDLDTIDGELKSLSNGLGQVENNKLDTSSVYNGLDQETAGQVLDAYQGKVLNDNLTALSDSLTGKLNKTIATTTGAFNSETIYKYANNVLENIRTNIDNYTTGIYGVESNGGPMYGAILYKYTNVYWCTILFTYTLGDPGYFYAKYQNGTCWVMRIN